MHEHPVTKEIQGEITLKNVTISYDGDEVLSNINLQIP